MSTSGQPFRHVPRMHSIPMGRPSRRLRRLELRIQLRRRERARRRQCDRVRSGRRGRRCLLDPLGDLAQLRGRAYALGLLALVRGGGSGARVGVRSVHARLRGCGEARARHLQPRGRGRRSERNSAYLTEYRHEGCSPLHAPVLSEPRRGHAQAAQIRPVDMAQIQPGQMRRSPGIVATEHDRHPDRDGLVGQRQRVNGGEG